MELTGFLPFWGKCMQETSTDTEASLVNFWKNQSMRYPRSPWHLCSTISLAAYNTEIPCLLCFLYPLCIWPFSPSSPSIAHSCWGGQNMITEHLLHWRPFWKSESQWQNEEVQIPSYMILHTGPSGTDQKISINWISRYKANLLLSLYLSFMELQENRQVICVTEKHCYLCMKCSA